MNIVFQGDSITDCGRGEGLGTGYAFMVSGFLGAEEPNRHTFYNRGVSGNRVVDMYARIKADCLNLNPDILSVLIGVNDVWHEIERQNGVDKEKFEKIYTMFLEEVIAHNPKIKIIVFGAYVLPGAATVNEEDPARWETFKKEVALRAEAAKRIAEKFSKNTIYVPLQAVFDAAVLLAPAEQWTPDGVHPSAQGHALIAKEWLRAYQEIMGK